MTESSPDIEAFRRVLSKAKNVVVLAGAGLSAGSGIPTYRGVDGLWVARDQKEYATPEGFKQHASRIWRFYHNRREICLRAKPNAAHRALVSLGVPSVRQRVLPSLADPTQPPLFITQNYDSLTFRALETLAADGTLTPEAFEVAKARHIEMHGSIFQTTCLQCKNERRSYDMPLATAFQDQLLSDEELRAATLSDDTGEKLPLEQLPRCGGPAWNGSNRYGRCGGPLRPGVVWFGEVPKGLGEIARVLNWTDVLIVIGTSALVHPAAGFIKTVKDRGGIVAVFNIEPSAADEHADFIFLGPCEERLPQVLQVPV